MNIHWIWLPLLLALLFISKPADGAKQDESQTTAKQSDETSTVLITTVADSDTKASLKISHNSTFSSNNTTKTTEKASYPKKVQSLKKRPTKTPTSYVTAATTSNSKSKRKKVTDVTAAFKDLPADDLEFIKELDKQFQLHGEKIKIKVEHDNTTESEKQNSKRTIDGELGYGAYSSHNGYHYERPKFVFYPYSQQNIPADAPGYYPPKTDVSIEPSYSYELQPQSYVEQPEHGAEQPPNVLDVPRHPHQPTTQQAQHGGYEEPVIVLRIPGPTKYASHLQTLLQQYLEIRAAQYLRILEEAEQQSHQSHVQHQQQQHQVLQQQQHEQQAHLYEEQVQQQQHAVAPAQAYAEPTHELQPPTHGQHTAQQLTAAEEEHGYSPEVTYAHQVAATPQPIAYPGINEVYQGYKGKVNAQHEAPLQQHHLVQHQHHQQQQQEVEYVPQQQIEAEHPQQQYFVHAAQQPAVPQYYYVPEAQFGAHGGSTHYQNVYFMAISPQGAYDGHAAQHAASLQHQPIYVQEEEQDLQQHHHQHQPAAPQQSLQQHEQQHELAAAHAEALNENSPRQTHTKVIYTHNSEKGAADYAGSYKLPSIRPFERHASTSAAAYHHQQQLQAQLLHEQQHEQLELEQQEYQQPELHQQQIDYDAAPTHAASENEQSAAVTPRPFNYHAHSAKPARRRGNRKRGATTPPTTAAPSVAQVDEHLQKIRNFVRENLGAQMSTAVEYKTTTVVKS
ncbi:putative mediator of RNA polymerase II transcription subunit 26 [Rhagoletis pomonella]|uniref:putative mediator of RNA polymerase II transcription subunit 26 n=1 Tax=Rhagoletis pomonella TaxID=28610 RepID=UPI00177A98AD|nr:putative mediator of RNA polymerase II transcription subunit 26 [Rhagoletis pomonella]